MTRSIVYYKSKNNKCYVQEFIDSQPPKVQQKIFWTLKLLRELDFLKEPYFKKLTNADNIWETRIKFGSNIYRIFFFFDNRNIVVLTHGFQKKTNKTPKEEIKKATELKKDYLKNKEKNKHG